MAQTWLDLVWRSIAPTALEAMAETQGGRSPLHRQLLRLDLSCTPLTHTAAI